MTAVIRWAGLRAGWGRGWVWGWALCLAWLAGPTWAADLTTADVLWLDRLTFGISPDSVFELQRLGRKAWLDEQLRPGAGGLPTAVQQQVAGLSVSRRTTQDVLDSVQALVGSQAASAGDQRPPARQEAEVLSHEAAQRTVLLATHSRWQVQEMMTWFWFNHFNVSARGKPTMVALVGDYENALRQHALGRFSDLLRTVATHPAMLIYLNNDRNVAGHINENYARELMELHTLGVQGGYTQQDVQQLARVLTGLGVRPQGGAGALTEGMLSLSGGTSAFVPRRHMEGPKELLGHTLNGQGWAQIEQALDVLARHPSTARYIAAKLAQFFVADAPPPALVERLARRFSETGGDIAAVVKTLAESPELEASLDRKFKDPMRYVISAVRLSLPSGQVLEHPQGVQRWLNLLGQPLFGRITPDGYPMTATAWNSSGQMSQRFDVSTMVANQMGKELTADAPFVRAVLTPLLSEQTRQSLAQVARQPREWRVLLLASPEFMTR